MYVSGRSAFKDNNKYLLETGALQYYKNIGIQELCFNWLEKEKNQNSPLNTANSRFYIW